MSFSGPDGIPPIFRKWCHKQMVKPIYSLIKKSLKTGEFLNKWKYLYIKPTYKKGDKKDVKNYRPIFKPSTFAKIYDSIITIKISPFLTQFISDLQHAYIKNRSTCTNLACLFEESISSVDQQ